MNYKKLLILGIFASTSANAGSSITCPATVQAGQQLTFTATVTNNNCDDQMVINKAVFSIIGGSTGVIGLQGPFVVSIPAIPIPTAQCVPNYPDHPEYGSHFVSEGYQTFTDVTAAATFPESMKGKLALFTAGVIQEDNNKLRVVGSCYVTVN
jgi:hypothetical protein